MANACKELRYYSVLKKGQRIIVNCPRGSRFQAEPVVIVKNAAGLELKQRSGTAGGLCR